MSKKLSFASTVGNLTLTEEDGLITALELNSPAFCNDGSPLLEKARCEIEEYFAKRRKAFTFPFKAWGTAFEEKVWNELESIPYGETISYGELAKRIGNKKAARAVGGANHRNPLPIIIPCHRVIGKNGSLTGYGGGLKIKRFLLELENTATLQ
jgi:O-6-methylguanine DNA methyltransferase